MSPNTCQLSVSLYRPPVWGCRPLHPCFLNRRSSVLLLVGTWGRKGSTGRVGPGLQAECARTRKSTGTNVTGNSNQYALAA